MESQLTPRTQRTVQVIATTLTGTRAALATAVPLAAGCSARLVLLVPRIIPFPAQLEQEPEVTVDFFARRYRALVEAYGASARIQICVCRKLDELVNRLLDRNDTVVIGGPAGYWLTSPEERFASRIARRVARVVFVPTAADVPERAPAREVDECSTS